MKAMLGPVSPIKMVDEKEKMRRCGGGGEQKNKLRENNFTKIQPAQPSSNSPSHPVVAMPSFFNNKTIIL